jgi:glutamate/tyrosine decarboxylase-like PLP-dependent enzyme
MGAGMFFCRWPRFSEAAFSVETGYVPDAEPGTADLYRQTLQWSRRFIGLKVFLTLAELGEAGVAAIVDHQAAMGRLLREALAEAGWQVRNDSPLPLVCFTPADAPPESVPAIARAVAAEGTAWISDVHLPTGERWLRACITHHETGPEDVHALVQALGRARKATAG